MIVETPSPKLRQVWNEWLDKYRVLKSSSSEIEALAAPFFSSAHINYSMQQRVVLFVGKATDQDYFLPNFENDLWKKSNMPGADSGTWWLRSPTRDSPSFLWTMHPQFKSTLEKQAWVQRALWLMKKK